VDNLNPVILAIPVFFILMGLEVAYDYHKQRKLYRLNDAVSNISCGIVEQLTGLFAKIFTVAAYHFIFVNYAIFELESTWYWLLLAFIGIDFFYYWAHRMSHQVNLFWLGHVVHHQSEDYNLSVALRQSTLQKMFTFYFYFPMAFLGFKTEWFVLMGAFNLLYQFWIHTEVINKLPRWYEYLFNTPAHHRVHHGRDPKYIDKNHAGTLIIWDRMFGTFQQEEERPTYGITTPLNTWNPVMANLQPFVNLWKEVKTVSGFWNKVKLVWMPPGWYPASMGGFRAPKPVDKAAYSKFDVQISTGLNVYLLVQYLAILGLTSVFLFNTGHASMTTPLMALIAAFIVLSVAMIGMVFEDKNKSVRLELVRFAVTGVFAFYLMQLQMLPFWTIPAVVAAGIASVLVLRHTGFHRFVRVK
jgi:sterol desaturase/sphingolipid hydroxylase (fatty acid hydroxylase superfamily)